MWKAQSLVDKLGKNVGWVGSLSALKKAGYDPGPSDNIMGTRTKAALTKFQQDKALPVGNLDFDTLKALGVNY